VKSTNSVNQEVQDVRTSHNHFGPADADMSCVAETLASVLCGIAFDAGRTSAFGIVKDDMDIGGMLNFDMEKVGKAFLVQAHMLRSLAKMHATATDALEEMGYLAG